MPQGFGEPVPLTNGAVTVYDELRPHVRQKHFSCVQWRPPVRNSISSSFLTSSPPSYCSPFCPSKKKKRCPDFSEPEVLYRLKQKRRLKCFIALKKKNGALLFQSQQSEGDNALSY